VRVINYYDQTLQTITGCAFEPVIVSEGITFFEYLYLIFSSYPEIEKRYPPGILGFTINGTRPKDFITLKEEDSIYFTVVKYSIN